MDRWIKFLKMLGFAVAGAVASGVGNAIQAGQVHSVTDLKGAALGAGVAAAVAYLKLPHGAVDPAKDDAAK